MSFSVALTEATRDGLAAHLLRSDGQEDICFALWHPSQGRSRLTALVDEPILPRPGERHVHGNASFESAFFLRALAAARRNSCGLVLLHSHPDGSGWQGMSSDDVGAELGHAAQSQAATGRPLVGLTMSGDGALSGRLWSGSRRSVSREDACSVRIVGPGLKVTWNDALRPAPPETKRQIRTVSVWGTSAQRSLVRLRIGVVDSEVWARSWPRRSRELGSRNRPHRLRHHRRTQPGPSVACQNARCSQGPVEGRDAGAKTARERHSGQSEDRTTRVQRRRV